jgi:hypothetical protein
MQDTMEWYAVCVIRLSLVKEKEKNFHQLFMPLAAIFPTRFNTAISYNKIIILCHTSNALSFP